MPESFEKLNPMDTDKPENESKNETAKTLQLQPEMNDNTSENVQPEQKNFHFEEADIQAIDRRNQEYEETRRTRESMGLAPESESSDLERSYLASAEQYIERERKDPSFPIGTAVDFTMLLLTREEALQKYPGREKEIDAFLGRYSPEYKEGYVDTLTNNFNGAIDEYTFAWQRMAGEDGQLDYTQTDKMMEFVRSHPELSNNFRGQCTFWNRYKHLPDYLKGKPKEEIRREVIERRLEVLRRYPDVKEWVFLNEPLLREPRLDDNGVNQDEVVFDPEEDFDFFVELFKRAKEIAPDVKLYVNEYSILTGNQTGNYIKFIQKLLKAGAPIDGVGVQGHIFNGWDFASIPQMKENLDDLAKLGLPIKITEFDVSDEDMKRMYFPPGAEGITEQQLQEARADYTRKAMTIFYGNPKVNGICLWGFQDKTHWRGERETASPGVQEHAGLFDENFQPNQVGRAFQNLTQEQWKINIGGKNI